MSYHDLSSCTLSPDERQQEALKIAQMLDREHDSLSRPLTNTESDFLDMVLCGCPISVKQLFWMRDLKSKYLE